MNIKNLNQRSEFWGEHYLKKFQGNSSFDYLKKHRDIFKRKDVLEIGPGEGRQFDVVSSITKSYSVADISNMVLSQSIYRGITHKHLIRKYTDRIKTKSFVRFDVIHFWFVIHHVLKHEVESFINYVKVHTRNNGLILFNYPSFVSKKEEGNGMTTTMHDEGELLEFVRKWYNIIDIEKTDKHTIVLGIKQ